MATKFVIDKELFDFLESTYHECDIGMGNNGIVHLYKVPGASITIYRTGTLLIQGKQEEKYAQLIGGMLSSKAIQPKSSKKGRGSKSSKDNPFSNQAFIMGSDEVGNGSYTGGMTAAAVYVPKEAVSRLHALGVADSKTISDGRVLKLAEEIEKICPYFVMSLSPRQYNRAIDKGYNQVSLKVFMHNYCASKLQEANPDLKYQNYIVDGFTLQPSWDKYVAKEKEKCSVKARLIPHAEGKYLAVAAASILARAAFLAQIQSLSTESGIHLHQGISDYVRDDAFTLKSHGFDLTDYVKLHFKNTEMWGLK
mgnify:FL=1